MSDPEPPTLLERLAAMVLREPADRAQLTQLLRSAYRKNLLDAEALSIIEGAMTVSEMQVRDIMIPRAQMDVIDINEPIGQFIPVVISTSHSRFPVIGENRDDVIGVLLAKDLLRHYAGEEEFNVREMLRPAIFVPESKRLNVLLREFRENRNHIAVVIDEYGGVAGLVTIEDVLEEIVGDIEDEHDKQQDTFIKKLSENDYLVKALTPIEEFNEHFDATLSDEEFDTIGGIVMQAFGHLPRRNEVAEIEGFQFKVLNADSRQIHLLRLNLDPGTSGG